MPESTVITKQITVKPAKNLWIFIFASPHYITFIIADCFCTLYSFRLFFEIFFTKFCTKYFHRFYIKELWRANDKEHNLSFV